MVNVLVIGNDQPYGSERPYSALRLAGSLAKREGVNVRVFLFGDLVTARQLGSVGGARAHPLYAPARLRSRSQLTSVIESPVDSALAR